MPFDETREQHKSATHLPRPLYVVYMQASAYRDACGTCCNLYIITCSPAFIETLVVCRQHLNFVLGVFSCTCIGFLGHSFDFTILVCVTDKFIEVSIQGDLDVAKALGQTSTALGESNISCRSLFTYIVYFLYCVMQIVIVDTTRVPCSEWFNAVFR